MNPSRKQNLSRQLFPAFYGLLVYFTVRLLQDSVSGVRFWRRSWLVTAPEMAGSMLVGMFMVWLVNALIRRQDKLRAGQRPATGREILILVALNLVILNLTFTPLAAFTDDGLQWGDLAAINVVPTLYSLIYYGYRRALTWLQAYTDERLMREKLANDQLATELRFLRAQYHPHFLFNALNTIYFQMDEDVPRAKQTLEQFSELLRYQLYDQQEKVPLEKEIGYLSNYVALQKARSSEKLQLSLELPVGDPPVRLYPLLLLPLVENAFKYTGGDYLISIRLEWRAGIMQFHVSNSMGNFTAGPAGGIGLENLRRRLELLYPGKHQFSSMRTGEKNWLATLSIETE